MTDQIHPEARERLAAAFDAHGLTSAANTLRSGELDGLDIALFELSQALRERDEARDQLAQTLNAALKGGA